MQGQIVESQKTSIGYGVSMDKIDELLLDWWEWSLGYNSGTDYKAFDSTCAQFRTSRQWMEYDELDQEVEWNRKKAIGKQLEPMILQLDLRARVAINTECRNMSDGVDVWSCVRTDSQFDEYCRAKEILRPKLVSAGLIERLSGLSAYKNLDGNRLLI